MTDEDVILIINDMLQTINGFKLPVTDVITVFTACLATAINSERDEHGLVLAMKHINTVESSLRKMVLTYGEEDQ